MGYTSVATLTYGYDIAKIPGSSDLWDAAWDCCDPDEHGGHILQQEDAATKVRTIHDDTLGAWLLVAYHHRIEQSDGAVVLPSFPDTKSMDMELLWAAGILDLDISGLRPVWRMSTRYV